MSWQWPPPKRVRKWDQGKSWGFCLPAANTERTTKQVCSYLLLFTTMSRNFFPASSCGRAISPTRQVTEAQRCFPPPTLRLSHLHEPLIISTYRLWLPKWQEIAQPLFHRNEINTQKKNQMFIWENGIATFSCKKRFLKAHCLDWQLP